MIRVSALLLALSLAACSQPAAAQARAASVGNSGGGCTSNCSFDGTTTVSNLAGTGHFEVESLSSSNTVWSKAGDSQIGVGIATNAFLCLGMAANGTCRGARVSGNASSQFIVWAGLVVGNNDLIMTGVNSHLDVYGGNAITNSQPGTPTLFDDADGVAFKPAALGTPTSTVPVLKINANSGNAHGTPQSVCVWLEDGAGGHAWVSLSGGPCT